MIGRLGTAARWALVAAVTVLPTGIAATGSTAAVAGPAPVTAVTTAEDEPQAVTVLSGDEVVLRTTSHLRATVFFEETTAVGTVVVDGPCPKEGFLATLVDPDPVRSVRSARPLSAVAAPLPDGRTCAVRLSGPVRPSASATQTLVLADSTRTPAGVPATIHRNSGFLVYALLAALGAAAGGLALGVAVRAGKDRAVPSTWKLDDAHVTTLTALAAAGVPLLAATDVLDAYAPQFSTAGVLVIGIAVALLLAAAPFLFSLLPVPLWAYGVAGGLTTAAATLQIGSLLVVLLSGSLATDWARWALVILAVGLVSAVLVAVRVQTRAFPPRTGDGSVLETTAGSSSL